MKPRRIPLLTVLTLGPTVATAQLSANFGMVSDYIFRGVYQEDTSASAGIDFASDNGFYIGTWGADVGSGLETDLYLGYGFERGNLSWGVGYTGYFYTDDFDDTYNELNLNLGYGFFSFEVALGEWDGFGTPRDYQFTSLTFDIPNGPYFTLGSFGEDFDGSFLEIGYGFEFEGLDLSVALIASDDVSKPGSSILLSEDNPLAETALVFGISKSIDLSRSRSVE